MPRNTLGAFLKAMRQRLDRDLDRLGTYERAPARRGRAVTQEELAEAVDVSRGWYSLLESGASMRASTGMLSRVADALLLAEDERSELFRLARPELRVPSLQPVTLQVIQAFQLARKVAHKLWNASSEAEVMTYLSETVATRFPDADYVGNYQRVGLGQWTFPDVIGRQNLQQHVTEFTAQACAGLSPAEVDEAVLRPFLTKPGQVVSKSQAYPHMRFAPLLDRAYAQAGVPDATFDLAAVQTPDGLEGILFVCHFTDPQEASETDRAMLSAITDLASLALSPRSSPSFRANAAKRRA